MCPACWTRCRRGGLAQALAPEADVEENHEDRGKSLNIRLAGSYSWVGIEACGVDIQPNGIGGGEDLELAIKRSSKATAKLEGVGLSCLWTGGPLRTVLGGCCGCS